MNKVLKKCLAYKNSDNWDYRSSCARQPYGLSLHKKFRPLIRFLLIKSFFSTSRPTDQPTDHTAKLLEETKICNLKQTVRRAYSLT